ncbi:hypothetical protein CHU98_g2141 [Xylaria longipes]|nr:hypothetical protein CHU98_g2141 [Xylaria longipes]
MKSFAIRADKLLDSSPALSKQESELLLVRMTWGTRARTAKRLHYTGRHVQNLSSKSRSARRPSRSNYLPFEVDGKQCPKATGVRVEGRREHADGRGREWRVNEREAKFGVLVWDQASAAVEISQGKAIADAAVAAGASQFIWSSLPNISEMPGGKISVKHFDSKAEVERYIRTLDIKTLPSGPDTSLPLVDIQDVGKFIAPALLNPEHYHGKRFACATALYTLLEMVDTWTKVTGKKVRLAQPETAAEYTGLPEEQKKKKAKAAGLLGEYGYYGPTGNDDMI